MTKSIDFLQVALLLQECDRGIQSLSLDNLSEQDQELVRFCADNNLLKLRTLNGRERVRNITLNVFDLLNGCLDSAIWPAVEQALGDALATADVDLILNEIARAICRRAHESGNIKLVDGEWRFVQG